MLVQSQIKLEIRPNNQITLTKGSWKKREKIVSTSAYLDNNEIQSVPKIDTILQSKISLMADKREKDGFASFMHRRKPQPPLDIIRKSQRDCPIKKERRNKPRNFTRVSGQRLRECGAAVDIASKNTSRFCHEITLTLPANTHEAMSELAKNSYYCVNRLFQKIRRDYGDMVLWFFVWEYQKRGALHLHICVYHPDESEGQWICTQLIELWHKILCDISQDSGIDMFMNKKKTGCTLRQNHQHHTQPITKNVGAYFSKYAGKEESKDSWYCQKYPVSRFWGSSRTIKEIVKENSCCIDYDLVLEENAEKMYQEILESIIEKLQIVSTSSYEFAINLSGKGRINLYKDIEGKERKIVDHDSIRMIACGERFTFYCSPDSFQFALESIKARKEFF